LQHAFRTAAAKVCITADSRQRFRIFPHVEQSTAGYRQTSSVNASVNKQPSAIFEISVMRMQEYFKGHSFLLNHDSPISHSSTFRSKLKKQSRMIFRVLAILISTNSIGTLTADEPAIENSVFYDPVERNVEGWTVAVDPALLLDENSATAEEAFRALANHLQRVTYIVPAPQLAKLKKLRIWLDLQHPKLKSMQYHPSAGWLKNNGHDPRLARHVHIPQAKELFAAHMWAKHPYVVLHELAHAYHDQVLGFDDVEVKAAWDNASESGILKDVLLYTGKKVDHYGLTNHKEYFAESTEAYFGVNDFYPFVGAELNEHDPRMFSLMQKIWGKIR
jgi:hypothetical protein